MDPPKLLLALLPLSGLLLSGAATAQDGGNDLGFLGGDGRESPMARQEMWDLKHQYRDPETGVLRYEIRAAYATTRMGAEGTFFDVEGPVIEYYGKETMSLSSSLGVIDIRKERIWLQKEVVGFLDTARKARFVTREVEMDFQGRGESRSPIRFAQPGAVIEGARSRFFRSPDGGDDGNTAPGEADRMFEVIVFGPGRAQFEKVSPEARPPGAPGAIGSRFLVEFHGSATYSQARPRVTFRSDPEIASDRVRLYGDGYVMKCREMEVYPSADGQTWERVEAREDVTYETFRGDASAPLD
ncbi:MAG: hypothetical protein HYU36_25325 [Planctomycetes bacterium]|nr:hypothetical protein [Planctomycetota bacterium]